MKLEGESLFYTRTKKISFFFTFFSLLFFHTTENVIAAYRYEGIAFYADIIQGAENTPAHRFYNAITGDHFYTISNDEKEIVNNSPSWGYRYEGVGFYAKGSASDEDVPVYRFYNAITGDHFYTISNDEKDIVNNSPGWGYRYEGVGFYAKKIASESSIPIYRFYNSNTGDHFYTGSKIEKTRLMNGNLGPDISIGLWKMSRTDTKNTPFKIKANKDYLILDRAGAIIATISAGAETRVSYASDNQLKIYRSIPETLLDRSVSFQAADGYDADMIFDISRPDSPFDRYRGKMSVRYSETSKYVWMVNVLPLEQYVWGIGEITGTGDEDYNRAMVTAFRTYGLWKILYSTKYASEGFVVDATPGNQLYYGYDRETIYPRVRQAAENTIGKIAKFGDDIALTPYSSWTDGRTRSFLERWGSSAYPWCQSVSDPYGKNPTLSTAELEARGNHMVGISAHGALSLASDHEWGWQRILSYYLSDIFIPSAY